MFMLVSWFGLTLPLLNAADWFRLIRLLKRLFVSSHLSEVIYVWCYCWRYWFCSCWWRHGEIVLGRAKTRPLCDLREYAGRREQYPRQGLGWYSTRPSRR